MPIEKIILQGGIYPEVYRSDTTMALDEAFNLNDSPIAPDKRGVFIQAGFLGIQDHTAQLTMAYFTDVVAQLGFFVGLPLKEFLDYQIDNIEKTILLGLLQTYKHEGVIVVEPTLQYGNQVSTYGKIEREEQEEI